MIEALFTSKTRIKLLILFVFNQDREFHLREIARLVGFSPIHVSNELNNLCKINVISKYKKANLSIFSLNQNCIILNELRNILIKTDYVGEIIKKELKDKVKYCFVFGSFAKGIETKDSDIDLFIISEIKEDKLIKIIQKIETITKRETNYVLWDEKTLSTRAKKGHHLLRTIKKEKIVMIIGDEYEFKEQIK